MAQPRVSKTLTELKSLEELERRIQEHLGPVWETIRQIEARIVKLEKK